MPQAPSGWSAAKPASAYAPKPNGLPSIHWTAAVNAWTHSTAAVSAWTKAWPVSIFRPMLPRPVHGTKSLPRIDALPSRFHAMLASAALGASIAAPTHATAEYALQSGVSWYRFDNLFLFRNDSDNKLHTSDSAWSADLRGALFLPLPTGRSNLQLTASASQMHYSKFSAYTNSTGHGPYSLNRSKKQFDAMYTWAYGDLLHGHLRHRIDDRLYNYFGGEITPQTDPNGLP